MAACVLALGGCTGEAGDPAASATGAPSAGVDLTGSRSLPRLTQPRHLYLQAGLEDFFSTACIPRAAADLVCQASSGEKYSVLSDPTPTTLVDASMRLGADQMRWSVRLTFATRRPVQATARAATTEGFVLVLNFADEVLAAAPVGLVSSRRIVFTGLRKAEAWAMVERLDRLPAAR